MKRILTSLVVLAYCTGTASAAVQMYGDATTQRVSGTPNSDRVSTIGRPEGSSPLALKRIEWGERNDHPCWFKVTIGDMTQVPRPPASALDEVDRCAASGPTKRSTREVGYGTGFKYDYTLATTESVYVTGMRVCLNRKRTRIKGIQIEGKRVAAQGLNTLLDLEDLDGVINEPLRAHPNCKSNWRRWSRCGRNEVVVAVDVHFEAGPLPRSATGIAVQCRSVAGEDTLIRPTSAP